ncbi:MAG: hypothetical protein NT028_00035 [candidate division Zixibacteria bacterium]|nr:hypothetical protein [candidate division Zixibacteria bacterium]
MKIPSDYRGVWWLPSNPEKRITGTLRPIDDGDCVLDVLGSFQDQPAFNHLFQSEIILGHSENGTKLTLYKCFESSCNINSSGFQSSKLEPRAVFVGGHFASPAEVTFRSVSIHYSHVDEWANISGFKINSDWNSRTVTVSHSIPESVEVTIPDLGTVFIDVRPTWPALCAVQKEATIVQKTYVRIQPKEPLQIESFFEVMHRIEQFLSLAVSDAVCPLQMSGLSDRVTETYNGKVTYPGIEFYYKPANALERQTSIPPHKMLFIHKEVADKFPEYLATWMAKAETLGPVFDLYFGTLYNPRMYLDQRFLSIIHAIEAFHSRTYGGLWMLKQDYEPIYNTLVNSIPDGVSQDHRRSLDARLKYGNEFSLRKRLKETFDTWKDILQDFIPKENEFIEHVVDTRNYLTHHDESLKTRVAEGEDLYRLTEKLRLLAEACLLGTIGFQADTIKALFKRHAQWRIL